MATLSNDIELTEEQKEALSDFIYQVRTGGFSKEKIIFDGYSFGNLFGSRKRNIIRDWVKEHPVKKEETAEERYDRAMKGI